MKKQSSSCPKKTLKQWIPLTSAWITKIGIALSHDNRVPMKRALLLEELDTTALFGSWPDAAEATDIQRALDDDGQHGSEHDDHLYGVGPEHSLHPTLTGTDTMVEKQLEI